MNIHFNLNQEEPKKITNTKELAEHILKCGNDIEKMSDEDRAKMDAQIIAKLKFGKKLSQKEMNYLQKTNPIMYAHAMRVQTMAKAVEEKLKHAKSKEEANRIVSDAIGGISKDDPDKEYIVAAVNRVSNEMRKSPAYSRLPDTNGDVQNERKKQSENNFEEAEEDDENVDEKFDLSSWSPLQEVIDCMPKFVANV